MKISLVTGGAGFIGSHLCEKLVQAGRQVVAVDNFITGNRENLNGLTKNPAFTLIEADAANPPSTYLTKKLKVSEIFHLASPASPRGYQDAPVETYKVNSFGTHYLLEYARQTGAKFLFASTSEVYGDPLEHPQKESYWGNVHIRGVRACYDESKRFGEMALTVFQRLYHTDGRTARIFNTYGPRMDPRDGRVLPNFITQALANRPITVYGDGSQTRSFCYVSDMVGAILTLMDSEKARGEVYNVGNPVELTMLAMAEKVKTATGSRSEIVFTDLPEDDPSRRKPDITKIKNAIGWVPRVDLDEGLEKTIDYFRAKIG